MAPFCLLGHDDQKEMQHDTFGYVMPMGPSMALLHLFSPDNQNEVQQNFFGSWNAIVARSVSHDINNVINGTIPFIRSR